MHGRGKAASEALVFIITMTCHITRNGTRIACSRVDGAAEGVMLRVPKDANRLDDAALSVDGKPLGLKLLAERGGPVGWLNWVEAKKPGGGANALEEILSAMQRRGVHVVGIEIVRRDGGDVQALIDFYAARGFVCDASFASARPVMLRELG